MLWKFILMFLTLACSLTLLSSYVEACLNKGQDKVGSIAHDILVSLTCVGWALIYALSLSS